MRLSGTSRSNRANCRTNGVCRALEDGVFMAGLEAHYAARDIEARILAAIRAAD